MAGGTRKPLRRWLLWRKPISMDSLKMMVLSGVVRRADGSPPLMPTRTVYWHHEDTASATASESRPAQGWLSRWLGRKVPASTSQPSQ